MHTQTCELMHGASVRVLIPRETLKEDAIELLRKITHCIEKNGIYSPDEESDICF